MADSLLYLDHHATTPLDPRVLEVMDQIYRQVPGNPASTSHQAGERARRVVRDSRDLMANSLKCQPQELIFTSGATEANNLVIKGLFAPGSPPRHFVTAVAEHRAILDPARRIRRWGHSVTLLPVDSLGRVSPEAVRQSLTDQTRLVSVMLANNEVGTLNHLTGIAEVCREKEVLLHTDASQAIGKIPVSLDALPVDLLSFTAHKIYGPAGIGALFIRKGERRPALQPLLDGGGHEQGLRNGTLPVSLIAGFSHALALAVGGLNQEAARLASLREQLWVSIQRNIPGVRRNGDPKETLPGNLNITLPNLDGEALLAALLKTRLCVSSGSACTSANPEPSHVLKAMGLSDQQAKASLRFGLGRGTGSQEIDEAVDILTVIVEQLNTQ